MRILTVTGIVDERGPKTYAVNPVSRTLLDPGWTNGLKHLYVEVPSTDQVLFLSIGTT